MKGLNTTSSKHEIKTNYEKRIFSDMELSKTEFKTLGAEEHG
ncbi:MAG: hypothetical protein ACLU3F_00415 [Blautia wexlerae]